MVPAPTTPSVRGSEVMWFRRPRRLASGRGHHVAARDAEGIWILVGLFEDRECPLAQRLHLSARLEHGTTGHPDWVLARMVVEIAGRRVRRKGDLMLFVPGYLETVRSEQVCECLAFMPCEGRRAGGLAKRLPDRLARRARQF